VAVVTDMNSGGVSRVVKAGALLTVAALLGALGVYWEITPSHDGSPQDIVADAVQLVAIVLAAVGAVRLAAIESRPLSTRVVVMGLALGLVPYVLLIDVPGYVFNAGFLLATLSSAIAIWRIPSK
jgi:hypothetical protein